MTPAASPLQKPPRLGSLFYSKSLPRSRANFKEHKHSILAASTITIFSARTAKQQQSLKTQTGRESKTFCASEMSFLQKREAVTENELMENNGKRLATHEET